jgi:replication factor C large subunit
LTYLWTEKYRPSKISQIVGNKEAVTEFLAWIETWRKGRPSKKAALLYGPPGVGKTSLVHAFGKENGWEVIELNASDFRTREVIERVVGAASTLGSITGATGRIILVDEVDGIDVRADTGAVQALTRLIGETRVPIVLVANDPWDPKLAALREMCQLIQFRRIPKPTVASVIKKIATSEGLKISEDKIKEIAEKSGGDLRSALNDLQIAAAADLEVAERDREKEIFAALTSVFHSGKYSEAVAALQNLDLEPAEFFTWVLDNVPDQLTVEDLASAMEFLSKADLFLQRVNLKQFWGLLRYAIPLMTAGVAVSKKAKPEQFVRYSYPSRIRFLSSTRAERELLDGICLKIGRALHMSSRKARTEMLPFVKLMLTHNGRGLAEFFNLTQRELEYLKGESVSRPARKARGRSP